LIEYAIDELTAAEVSGWAFDSDAQETVIRVELAFDDGSSVSMPADTYRPDLEAANIRGGRASFVFDLASTRVGSPLRDINFFAGDVSLQKRLTAEERIVWAIDKDPRPFLATQRCKIDCALVLIIKDESRYILEWIEYHRLIGVDHFLIFDNGSSDGLAELLSWYCAQGIVTLIGWPNLTSLSEGDLQRGWFEQDFACQYAIRLLTGHSRWVGILDVDEFVALEAPFRRDLPGFLDRTGLPTVSLFWRMFGTSGHSVEPAGLITENYVRRSQDVESAATKVFVMPDRVHALNNTHSIVTQLATEDPRTRVKGIDTRGRMARGNDPLLPEYFGGAIHHYHTRSAAEYHRKVLRGWPKNTDYKNSRWLEMLHFVDSDNVEDRALVEFGAEIRARMARIECARNVRVSASNPDLSGWLLRVRPSVIFFHEVIALPSGRFDLLGFICDVARPDRRFDLELIDDFGTVTATVTANRESSAARAYRFAGGDYGFFAPGLPRDVRWCRWSEGLFRLVGV